MLTLRSGLAALVVSVGALVVGGVSEARPGPCKPKVILQCTSVPLPGFPSPGYVTSCTATIDTKHCEEASSVSATVRPYDSAGTAGAASVPFDLPGAIAPGFKGDIQFVFVTFGFPPVRNDVTVTVGNPGGAPDSSAERVP